jgi:hypothetical protein
MTITKVLLNQNNEAVIIYTKNKYINIFSVHPSSIHTSHLPCGERSINPVFLNLPSACEYWMLGENRI